MLTTIHGIIMKSIKYGETSIIIDVLTLEFGLRTYLMNGARNTKNSKASIFQISNQIEMIVYHRLDKDINRIKEVRLLYAYQKIPFDTIYSSLAMFVIELTKQTLHDSQEDTEICQWLIDSLQALDRGEENTATFHINYMIHMTFILGIQPDISGYNDGSYFSIKENTFYDGSSSPNLANTTREFVSCIQNNTIDNRMTKSQRKQLLQFLLYYFTFYIPNFKEPKSLKIFSEIFE